jgi:hypothetical protein
MTKRTPPRHASHAVLMLRYGEPLRTLTAPVPHSWVALLDGAAATQGVARSDLIRDILEAWIREQGLLAPPPERRDTEGT